MVYRAEERGIISNGVKKIGRLEDRKTRKIRFVTPSLRYKITTSGKDHAGIVS